MLLLSAVAIGRTLLRAAPTLRCVALLCHAVLLGFVELHLLAEDSAAGGAVAAHARRGSSPPPSAAGSSWSSVCMLTMAGWRRRRFAGGYCFRCTRGARHARRAHWRRVAGGILGAAAFPSRCSALPARELRLFDAAPPPMAPAVAVLRLTLLGWATLTAHSLCRPLLRAVAAAVAARRHRRRRPLRRRRIAARRWRSAAARRAAQSLCVLVGAGSTLCALVQVKRRHCHLHHHLLLHISRHSVPSPSSYIRPQPRSIPCC